jgi:hypothetical protein
MIPPVGASGRAAGRPEEDRMSIPRRVLLTGGLTLAAGLIARPAATAARPTVTVYKSPT